MNSEPLLNLMEISLWAGGELRADRGALHRAAETTPQRNQSQINLAVVAHCSVKDDASALRKGKKMSTKHITVKVVERVATLMAARHDSLNRGVIVVRSDERGSIASKCGSKCIAKWLPLHDPSKSNFCPIDVVITRGEHWANLAQFEIEKGFRFEWKAHSSRSLVSVRHKPLWRLLVNIVDEEKFDVIVCYNHAVADGTSASVLVHDIVQALNATLVKERGFEAKFMREAYRAPDLFTALYGKPYTVGNKVRLLGTAGRFVGRNASTFAKPAWLVDQLTAGIPLRFNTNMAYTDVLDSERWAAALHNAKQQNVRPQALMMAVAMALEAVYLMLRDPKKSAYQKDVLMFVSLRSDERVPDGHVHARLDDAQLTTGMVTVDILKVKRSDSFWTLARSIQDKVAKKVNVETLRDETSLSCGLFGTLCCSGVNGPAFVNPGFSCINLGRSYHFCGSEFDANTRFSHLRVDCAHFAQTMFPEYTETFGAIWPLDIDGRVTLNMEYSSNLWTLAEANEILSLFVETLLRSKELSTLDELVRQIGESSHVFNRRDKQLLQ